MTYRTHLAGAALWCLALGGCGAKSGDTSSVVATVDGNPVTLNDLRLEEQGPPQVASAPANPALDQAALRTIIDRRLMAAAAADQKLDKLPGYQPEATRAVEGVKAAALARKVMASAPDPTAEQVDKFIADHPRAFRDRKFLVIDQIQLQRPQVPLRAGQAPHTLADFQTLLDAAKIPYQRRLDLVDSGAVDAKLVEGLLAVAPHAIFQVSMPNGLTINQIQEVRAAPLSGPAAVEVAKTYLRNQAAETAARDYLENLRKAAKNKIKYTAAYEPKAAL
jgi:EpsD family peptidyl-prolyl cis-trans isomerase